MKSNSLEHGEQCPAQAELPVCTAPQQGNVKLLNSPPACRNQPQSTRDGKFCTLPLELHPAAQQLRGKGEVCQVSFHSCAKMRGFQCKPSFEIKCIQQQQRTQARTTPLNFQILYSA